MEKLRKHQFGVKNVEWHFVLSHVLKIGTPRNKVRIVLLIKILTNNKNIKLDRDNYKIYINIIIIAMIQKFVNEAK